MKIIHRLGFRASPEQRAQLNALGVRLPAGIALPGGSDPLVAFDVAEDHPAWHAVAELVKAWEASDVVRTEFSASEVDAARWLEPRVDAYRGYPQPREEVQGYLEVTYDLSDYCRTCGVGKQQKAPFVMKGEPAWGGRHVMQLNWVYDEYFVTPEAWQRAFAPAGVQQQPVVDTAGRTLSTVVQLVIDGGVDLHLDGMRPVRCAVCERDKYPPVARGLFPALRAEPALSLVRSSSWFGSGAEAHRGVVLRQDLAQCLKDGLDKGLGFRPVAAR